MLKYNNALIISSSNLRNLLRNNALYVVLGLFVVLSLFAYWDTAREMLVVAGIPLELFSIGKSPAEALTVYFYEIFSCFWVLLLFFYILPQIIIPLGKSFTVNQSLWIRLTPASSFDLALSRVVFLLAGVLFLGLLAAGWAGLYALIKGIPFFPLLYPIAGLTSYVLLSGAIIITIALSPGMSASWRETVAFIAIFTPMLLLLPAQALGSKTGGFFPYTLPFITERYGTAVWKPFFAAAVLGALLIGIRLAHNLLYSFYYKNLTKT